MPLRVYPMYILLQLLLAVATFKARAQSWQWTAKAGGPGSDQGSAIDVDAAGNSYITGSFQDSIAFGTVVLHSPGTSLFIAKYTSTGSIVWARLAAAGTAMIVTGISVDRAGNPAIIGLFAGSAAFGSSSTVPLTASAGYDVFTASYSASGAIRWARATGGPGYDYSSGISRNALGNIYITGELHTSSFNGSSAKIFVVRYDTAGNNAWLDSSLNYSAGTYAQGIRTDSEGNSYIVGAYFNHLTFDADSAVAINAGNIESNVYIGKLSPSGRALWLQTAGAASGYTGGNAIDIDAAGNAYVTGSFHGTINFGPLSLAGQYGTASEPFLAKCAANGTFLWATKPTGPASAYHISTDAMGNSYITGNFSTNITFGTATLSNTGGADIYIARANSAGSFLWATQCGGVATLAPGDIKARGNSIYLTGGFLNTIYFGAADSLVAQGSKSDVFLARLVDNTLNIEEPPTTSSYSLCPNPVKDKLALKGPTVGNTYIIYDAAGRAVLKGKFDNTSIIPTGSLPAGTYILSIHSQSGKPSHLRFVKY